MPFDLQPHLEGQLVELRPLRPGDWEQLLAVASDPLIWEQHPQRDRWQRDVFRRFFDEALRETECCGGAFAVIDRSTGNIIGSTRFHGCDAARSEVEIGWTFLARSHWGGRYNREMKQLMLDHAFRFVERVIFLVGEDNIRSQTAMQRIGGVRSGFIDKVDFGGTTSRSVRYVIQRPAPGPRISLRDALESDLMAFFQFQLDPIANRMAAFTAKDPTDQAAFMAKWTRNLSDPTILLQAITVEGEVVGVIGSFLATWGPPPPAPPQRHVTYWIAREHWGKGLATMALRLFLRDPRMGERPLHASAARDNLASLRVLQKCGFVVTGHEKSFANARGQEIEETMLLLA